MATIITHGIVAYVIGKSFSPKLMTTPVIVCGIILSMLPDADVLAFSFGIPYASPLGHRGFTHSILFALLVALVFAWMFNRKHHADFINLFLYFFFAVLSHGILDAMTSGGKGIGFFIPFVNERYFFPFRPILVSPIGIDDFISSRGFAVIKSEMLIVWIPALFVLLGFSSWRKMAQKP